MWLVRAERFLTDEPTHVWYGLTEYDHGHRADDSLQAVARHWLLQESARLFTGTENEPERFGPFTTSPDLWRRFQKATAEEVIAAVGNWGADADRYAHTNTAEKELTTWATTRLGESTPDACLLLVPTDDDLSSQPMPWIGVCVGFVVALWIRPADNRLVAVVCSDD